MNRKILYTQRGNSTVFRQDLLGRLFSQAESTVYMQESTTPRS
ncbi:MAG: hypothetical protein PHP01_05660 [Phycisphaerae bacterium]|nr:hypothetical protein [Phycisphaerae bacterium]